MLNKIEYFKGFSEYTEGVERWSDTSNSYLFGVKETGVTGTNTGEGEGNLEGKKEKAYFRYEFSRLLPVKEVADEFIRVYAGYKGYPPERQAELSVCGSELEKAQLAYVLAEAEYYASGLCGTDRTEPFRRLKQAEISVYDVSPNVNEFTLTGNRIWLSRDTRVSLSNSINIEKSAGKKETTLWFDGVCYKIPIEQALQMLSALEIYALDCYNATHKHLAAVGKLTAMEAIKAYDYKTGYPEKLNFDNKGIRVC